MNLRAHQIDSLQAIDNALLHYPSTLAVAATGTGKTTVIAEYVRRWLERSPISRVLTIAHTYEIVSQLQDRIESFGSLTGLECGGHFSSGERSIVAAIQALTPGSKRFKRALRPTPFDLVIIDEAHHAAARSYRDLLKALPPHKLLGLTATPHRGDKRPLSSVFASVAHTYSVDEAIKDGHLVPHITHHANSARELVSLVGDRRTIVFCKSVESSKRLAQDLQSLGVTAVHVDGEMSLKVRARILQDFANNKTQYLINCQLVREGWDVPGVECVATMRSVGSPGPMSQMLGRGVRAAPGKRECLLITLPNQVPLDTSTPNGSRALAGIEKSERKQRRSARRSARTASVVVPASPVVRLPLGQRIGNGIRRFLDRIF